MLGDILLGGLENDYDYFSFRKIRGSARVPSAQIVSQTAVCPIIKTEKYFSYRTKKPLKICFAHLITNDKRFALLTQIFFFGFLLRKWIKLFMLF